MIPFLLFIFLTLTPASAILSDAVLMGSECSADLHCISQLLYCSDTGVCTCNQTLSNLVFEHDRLSGDIDAWCEVRPCSLNKTLDIDECLLQNAECVPNPLVGGENFCNCPEGTVGASVVRFPSYPIVTYSKCVNFQLSTINEPCWMDKLDRKIMNISNHFTYPVCDRHKKLKCDKNNLCTCHKDYKFDHSEDLCVKMVGGHTNLCDSTEECHGEMVCKNQRCNCRPDCEQQYVIEDNICVCPTPSNIARNILLSALVFSIVFIIILVCTYYRERKKRSGFLINQGEISLQPSPLHPNSSNNDQIWPDRHAASAPVLYPESTLPTYSSQISDDLPTYNDVTQTNLKKHEVIIEHHR